MTAIDGGDSVVSSRVTDITDFDSSHCVFHRYTTAQSAANNIRKTITHKNSNAVDV